MLAEQALREFPVRRQPAGLLHQGMHPGDAPRDVWILDAMTRLGVVLHDLAGPAATQLVQLEEDGVSTTGDAQAVLQDEAFDDQRVEEAAQEGDEGRVAVRTDAAGHHVFREEAERLGLRFVQPGGAVFPPVWAGFLVGMVPVELLRGVVVAAAGLMVAAAHGFVQRLPGLIDIEREAALTPTRRAGVAGGDPAVFLQGVHVRWGCVHLSTTTDSVVAVGSEDEVDS